VASLAALAGQTADLLDEGVGLRAGEFLDHGSEHVAQEPHVAAKELVVAHGGCGCG
jgi:hypothetical protein